MLWGAWFGGEAGDVALLVDGVAEPLFGAGLVSSGVEEEGAAEVGFVDGPAGEDGGEGGDIRLGVAAVDADGVELHDLAAEVFVEALVAAFGFRVGGVDAVGEGVGADGEPVVEVDHHGGGGGSGEEEVAEVAEGVLADGVALKGGGVPLV